MQRGFCYSEAEAARQRALLGEQAITQGFQENAAQSAATILTGGNENVGAEQNPYDGGQRDAGVGAGGQAGAVAEGAGGSVAGSKKASGVGAVTRYVASKQAVRRSAAEIGVYRGSTEKTVVVLPQEVVAQDEQLSEIQENVESEGASVVFFAGSLKVGRGGGRFSRAEGIRQVNADGSVTYFIKADKRTGSAEQIYRHEYFHGLISENRGLLLDLVEKLKQYGQKEIDRLVVAYVEAYDGIYGEFTEGMTQDQSDALAMEYLEELFADVYAGIQRGSVSTAKAQSVVENRRGAIDAAKENRRATRDTRGAPEQRYSIDKELKNVLSNVYNNTFDGKSGEVKIGETSDFLVREIGAKPLPNYMPANKAYSAMATEEKAKKDGKPIGDGYNYHGLGVDGLYELLERAETPVAAYADEPSETDGRFDRIVLVTDKEINGNFGVAIVEVESRSLSGRKRIETNKTITAYDKQAAIRAVQKAHIEGRLLYIDKKSGTMFDSGVKDANCPTAISENARKSNIQRFWENVKWAKYVKNSGSKIFTSGNQSNNAMAAALEKAGISVDSKRNEQLQEEPEAKQKFSLSEPVEETRELIAVHNLTEQNLEDAYEAGKLPTVEELSERGEAAGEISLLFDKENGKAPQRAVGLEEVRAAIVPDNIDNLLRRKLEQSGLYTVEYPAGDEQARLEALNSLYDELAQKEKTKRAKSDRELLSDVGASAAVENSQERKHLREYREAFEKLKKAKQKRDAIAAALETVEPDSAGAASLRASLRQLEEAIARYKGRLTKLKGSKPLQALLKRLQHTGRKQENPEKTLEINRKSSKVKMDNKSVRAWYLLQVSQIKGNIDTTLPMERQARIAFEARNRIRAEAREKMADEETRAYLEEKHPNLTFEDLVQSKMKRKGLTREEAILDVFETATKTNAKVNKELGMEEE